MQEILFAIFFLAIGFVLLIKGADFFVDGSSAVAKLLRVPPHHHRPDRGGHGDKPA